jgi:hypothetical protein
MKLPTTSILMLGLVMVALAAPAFGYDTLNFIGGEILSRPTDHSVAVSVVPTNVFEIRFEYGTDTLYGNLTPAETTVADTPLVTVLDGLSPDTRYFYRMRYRVLASGDSFLAPGRTFQTQRVSGERYTFDVEADPHMLPNQGDTAAAFELTLSTLAADKPDFLIDLGDNFMFDKWRTPSPDTVLKRVLLYRQWWGEVCHSMPLFIVMGNHEGEQGWDLDSTSNSTPVQFCTARKRYYANPVPDGFYTGDTTPEQFVGLRQDYYAWEWGNALFVVLDPYWHTLTKPNGLETNWNWTLGRTQYDWLKQTLEQSPAKFKFVFIHHLVGGKIDSTARGGIEYAHFYEWGGERSDSTWGFDAERPGWGVPIHQLLIDNHVDIMFHGHDHFFGKQDTDGVVYQECPQPARVRWESLPVQAARYGYRSGVFLGSRGYVRVTLADTSATVDYVRTFLPGETTQVHRNGMVAYSYKIVKPGGTGVAARQPELRRSGLVVSPSVFRHAVTIGYTLGAPGTMRLDVYDAAGIRIKTLAAGRSDPGWHEVIWNGTDDRGRRLPTAVYFARLEGSGQSEVRRATLLK